MHTILIADDERALRALVRATLETGRFRILEAADGNEALELATQHRPDLVFLDWAMPLRSGLEVLRELRGRPETAQLTVIMLTARGQDFDRAAAAEAGADAYVTKPFSPLALLDAVRDTLGPSAFVP